MDIAITNSSAFYSGSSEADSIVSATVINVTVDALAGNDTISGIYSSSSINAGSGNDYIDNVQNGTIYAGTGNDTVHISKNNIIEYSNGNGNDVIISSGDDTIKLINTSVSKVYNSDSDAIIEIGSNGSIKLGGSKDQVIPFINSAGELEHYYAKDGAKVLYNASVGTDGNDYIINDRSGTSSSPLNINSAGGNDTILNRGNRVLINAGSGDDLINNEVSGNVTINAGVGNDTINATNFTDVIQFASTDGNDIISLISGDVNFGGYIEINDNSSVSSYSFKEDEHIFKIGTGSITFKGVNDNLAYKIFGIKNSDGTIRYVNGNSLKDAGSSTGTDNDDYLSAIDSRVTLSGGLGDDFIFGRSLTTGSLILGGEHDDTIYSVSNSGITIDSGKGDDLIQHVGGSVYINSGSGNDLIEIEPTSSSAVITVNGGVGNDTIRNAFINTASSSSSLPHNRIIQYANGDGDDIVEDYDVGDRISLSGNVTASLKGNDVVLTIGEGSLTLLNTKHKSISIIGKSPTIVGSGVNTVTGITYNDDWTAIKVSNQYKGAALTPNFYDPSIVTVDASARTTALSVRGNDNDNYVLGGTKNDSIHGGDGADTLLGGKGNDTLTGGNGADVFFFGKSSGKDVITDYTADQDAIKLDSIKFTKVATVKGTNDLTLTVGGTIKIQDGAGKKIKIIDQNGNTTNQVYGLSSVSINDSDESLFNASVDAAVVTVDSYARTSNISIVGNAKANVFRTGIANETITTGKGKDTIIYSGGNDIITDYAAGSDVIQFSKDYAASINGSDVIFTMNDGSGTLKVKNAINSKGVSQKITVTNKNGLTSAQAYGMASISVGASDGETVEANSVVEVANASKRSKSVYLLGNSNKNSLMGGTKADTLDGGTNDDVLTGGKGNDVFIYGSGNDTITDYTVKQDKIQISGLKYSTYSTRGNDAIFGFSGNNSLTVVDGKDKILAFEAINGGVAPNSTTYGNPYEIAFAKNDKTTIYTADSLVETIDASKKTSKMKIIGNSKANVITGGKGNETIDGGAGNDLITGGKGKDVFIVSSGNDTINDYTTAQDTVKFDTSISSASISNDDDLVFGTPNGSIRLKNAARIKVTVTDSSGRTTSQIYGTDSISLANTDGATIDTSTVVNSKIVNIDASKRTKAVAIVGNAQNNTIKTGKGADTLTGGSGADTFIYTSGYGKDVITDYTANTDVLNIVGGVVKKASTIKGTQDLTLTITKGSIKLINGAGKKLTINDSSGTFKQMFGTESISIANGDGASISAAVDSAVVTLDSSARTQDLTITGNAKANVFNTGSANETITTGKGKDTVIYKGGNDVITDYTAGEVIKFNSDFNVSLNGSDLIYTIGSNTLTVKGVISKKGVSTKVTTIDKDGILAAQNYGLNILSIANTDGNTIKANENVEVMDASKRSQPVYLLGNSKANTLKGGSKADTLAGGSGNDVLTGGKGTDTFIYSGGNDTITDYAAGQDMIQISGARYSGSYTVNGKDVVLSFSSGNLTVVNGKDKMLSFEASNSGQAPSSTIYADPREMTFTKSTSTNTYTANSLIVTINAANNSKAIYITGNSNNNIIKGSGKADTIDGGAGNDSITGGKGKDVFIASAGNDTVTDYTAGQDKLLFKESVTNVSVSGDDLVFRTGSGNTTLLKAAKKKITVTDKDGKTTTQVYGSSTTSSIVSFNYDELIDEPINGLLNDGLANDYTAPTELETILTPETSLVDNTITKDYQQTNEYNQFSMNNYQLTTNKDE